MSNIQHAALGYAENHVAHAYEYANASQRTGDTGFVPADVGKLALQLDDLSLWMLADDSPIVWTVVILTGTIAVDTITEETPNAGVTVEGVLCKDSIVTASGGFVGTVTGGIYHNAYVKISDVVAYDASVGTISANQWETLPFNTEDSDTENIASISSDLITLEAGTYDYEINTVFWGTLNSKLRLYDNTGAAELDKGLSVIAGAGNMANSRMSGVFTIGVQSVINIQYYVQTNQPTDGLGNATGSVVGTGTNIYRTAEFRRRV